MPYTSTRDIELIEVGSLGKEVLSNDAFENLSKGISGTATIALTGPTYTLTDAEAQAFVLIVTGALTAHVSLTVPADSRVYIVDNRTTGAFNVSLFPSAGGGVAALQGERTLVYCDGTNVYPVASGSGGGGSGAPTDASYLVGAAHALLSAERVVTNTPTVTWDLATAAQAKAQVPDGAITFAKMQPIAASKLLGRYAAGSGDVQEVTLSTGLALDGSGNLTATATGQPLDATLTALAAVTTAADTLEYFTGVDVAASTPLTPLARTLLDDTTQAAMHGTLGLVPGTNVQTHDATLTALAGVTTGADMLQFFTGVDTASTTPFSPLARALLDDTTQAAMQATIGVTGGGGGSTDFLGLTDTPDSYSGQGGKAVLVNAGATALEFGTPAAGVSTFLALSDTPDTYAGQAGKGVVVNGAATALEFTTAATGSYDLGLTWSGTLPASQVLMRYPFPRAVDFPAGLTGSQGRAAVAATALTTLDLRKNGTSVGSVQFAAAGTTATFTMASATSFAAGDVLTVHAPASADATLADLGLSLAGTRAVVAGEMGATTWLGLTDTPDAYTGQAGKVVQVNAGATALEFGTAPAAGHTDEQIQDLMATTLTNSSHIQWTYNDTLGNLSSDIYGSSIGTAELTNDGVTYAKIQNVSATDRMLGRFSAGAGDVEEAVCTPAGRALLDDADTTAQRTTLGLGTMAQQDASAVAITGGDVTGLTTLHADRLGIGVGTAAFTRCYLRPSLDETGISMQPYNDGGGTAIQFRHYTGAPQVGAIITTNTVTSYGTTSDARLKHAVTALTGALDVVAALRPVAFRWNADDSQGHGFLAHELQQVIPDAVSGEPDAVNDDGSVKPQGVDHSKLVPWLTAMCQELDAQVQALAARVASLETQLGI